MKKKILIASLVFIMGFVAGVFFSSCVAQPVKDGSAVLIDNKAEYAVPEVYEMMQVAVALTDTSIRTDNVNMYANNVNKDTRYYAEVMEYFGQHKNHPLVKKLNKSFSKSAINYVYQLQRAYNAAFTGNVVKKNNKMPMVRRIWIGLHSVSRKELEKFATATGFRNFYAAHKNYYDSLLQDVKSKLDIASIQQWLEQQFPARYNKCQVVISPLSNGFHFTQNFIFEGNKTSVLWISAPSLDDTVKRPTDIATALYTSVAFTEIDHHYVNPITDKYKKEVNEIMGGTNRSKWIDEKGDAAMYQSGYKVFNEYMTHAVYLLYIKSKFSPSVYDIAQLTKVKSMVERRKYYRFAAFYAALESLYSNKSAAQTVAGLYPAMLNWCKNN